MKKAGLSVVLTMLVLSVNAQASSLAGHWCQKYDDFISVLKIEETGDLVVYAQGRQAGELVVEGKGFISQGASSMQMVVNGLDQQVVDAEVHTSLLGKKKLELIKADGSSMVYEACKAAK